MLFSAALTKLGRDSIYMNKPIVDFDIKLTEIPEPASISESESSNEIIEVTSDDDYSSSSQQSMRTKTAKRQPKMGLFDQVSQKATVISQLPPLHPISQQSPFSIHPQTPRPFHQLPLKFQAPIHPLPLLYGRDKPAIELKQLACQVGSIPCSEVECERYFSYLGMHYSPERQSLDPEQLLAEMYVALK
ncbi:hypothetical protein BLNAU_1863 [Blattamonas nauphoetae]|uniref:HAT C-terminal dimerisation domain-containing protein n=1 Tax=Blattamonas nauphoetae TaxID=2049346 RepID=A0ABQ9YHW1_9EUKA|nr:hypothetical protein BLNAU_1863 [Blattamonas nauphoetae]